MEGEQLVFLDRFRSPTPLDVGELLCWHDPDENAEVLCFKLELERWDYGEFIVIREELKWGQLASHPELKLTRKDLEWSELHLEEPFVFTYAIIQIENFSDSEDMIVARVAGSAKDTKGKSHNFQLRSRFHIVRPEKHADHWRTLLVEAMSERFPDFTLSRHYTQPSEYGLRYGDVYFSEFKNTNGDVILIQLVFDSSSSCDLYVSQPDDPRIPSEDRTFPFTARGLDKMTAYITRQFSRK